QIDDLAIDAPCARTKSERCGVRASPVATCFFAAAPYDGRFVVGERLGTVAFVNRTATSARGSRATELCAEHSQRSRCLAIKVRQQPAEMSFASNLSQRDGVDRLRFFPLPAERG